MGDLTVRDSTLQHAVEFGGGGFLHQGNAPGVDDGAQAERAVGGGAGEEDANGVFPLIQGQRAQE